MADAPRHPVAIETRDPLAGHDRLEWEVLANEVLVASPVLASHRAMIEAAAAYHRRTRTGASQASVHAARAHLADAQRTVLVSAREHFADYWLAERKLAINRAARNLISDLVTTTTAAASNGGDARAVIDAEVMRDEIDREAFAAHREQRIHAVSLNALLGRSSLAEVPPAVDRLPDQQAIPDQAALLAWADDLPTVLIARAHRLEAEANLALAERSIYPQTSAMAPGEDMMDFPPRPIPYELRSAVIEQWRALVAERTAEQRAAELSSQEMLLSARAHLDECLATLRLLGRQGDELRRVAELARNGFANGSASLSAVVLAQRALLDLEVTEATTRRDAFVWCGWLIQPAPETRER